jgi:arginyl-tRNA synthetase
MSILNSIKENVLKAFEQASYGKDNIEVSLSRRPELCDFQCNSALKMSGEYGVSPIEIAQKVADQLNANCSDTYVAVAVAPGFINISLTNQWLAKKLNAIADDPQLGYEHASQPKKIIVDFGGANVAKSLHVGHLRSAVIGESLIRILRFTGNEVLGDIHLGDWGLQIGLVIEMLRLSQPDLVYFEDSVLESYPDAPPFDIHQLTELYTNANIKSKEDPEFRAKAAESTAALQSGHRGYSALWKHIMNISVQDLKKNYGALGISFDLWLGESDSQAFIPTVLQWLENRKLLQASNGAKVVFVEEVSDNKPMPPCIIQKSNGAVLYGATDLATIYQRMRDYNPDEIIYVVDNRQTLHFEQVFRVAYKSKIVPPSTELNFIGFGTMNGVDGKPFKTRDGGVMSLSDLIHQLVEAASQRLGEQDEQKNNQQISLAVGVGALKFGDLSNLPERDYVFDLNQFSSFEGKTGPYVQYALVRIASIKKKLKEQGVSLSPITTATSDTERKLMLKLAMFSAWVDFVASAYQPSKICDYAFDLSQTFNQFYHEVHILSEKDLMKQSSYHSLLTLTENVLRQCLWLLGIEGLEKM